MTEVKQGANHVHYRYDANGNLTGITGQDGDTLSLAYDDAGRATQLQSSGGQHITLSCQPG